MVGRVELECLPEGLYLGFVNAALIAPDQAPLALAPETSSVVPWDRINSARVLGNALALDLAVGATRYSLVLVRFTLGHDTTPTEVYHRRILVRLFTLAVSVMVLVAALLTVPRLSVARGPYAGLGVGALLSLGVLGAGLFTDHVLVSGGRASAQVREMFVAELEATLPQLTRTAAQPSALKRQRTRSLEGVLPRTTLATAITLAAALLAALVMARFTLFDEHRAVAVRPHRLVTTGQQATPAAPDRFELPSSEPPGSAVEPKPSKASPVASTPVNTSASTNSLQVEGPCDCRRADSLLWSEPLRRLEWLVISSRRFREKEKDQLVLELATVNNGDKQLTDVSLLVEVTATDREDRSRLTSSATRALFYEGPLLPGKAVKWHVEAPGTSFKVHPPDFRGAPRDDTLGPFGEGAAPADAFFELLKANHRPVRLHAAMMLAYLGDPRARAAVIDLGDALRESEGPYLRRLLDVTAEQGVCRPEVSGSGNRRKISACLFNHAATPQGFLGLEVRLLDNTVSPRDPVGEPPAILESRIVPLIASVPAKSGLAVQAQLDWTRWPSTPAAIEVVLGRTRG